MDNGIVHETEVLIKYMGEFISPEIANYIDNLLKSYHSHYEGVENEVLENLYLKEFLEVLKIVKKQLREQGIEYDVLIAAHVIEE